MGIVGDAELVGDGQQQRVGFRDGLVLFQLLDQDVRLGGIAAAEDRLGLRGNKPDLVVLVAAAAEIGAIAVVGDGDDAARAS